MANDSVHTYVAGQRWLSETELEQGLGLLTQAEGRTLTVLFPATDEVRHYASQQAPLARYRLLPDDRGQHAEGWFFRVTEVEDKAGVLHYTGHREDTNETVSLPETQLAAQVATQHPLTRVLAGKTDRLDMYRLRQQAQRHLQRWQQSSVTGLLGARAQLLPHQLYIAHTLADRYQPRVLLADEVGLGKTIEAGLILQRRLLSGRSQRAAIVVPDSLCHQWLIELKRRFALAFSLFDQERCEQTAIDFDNVFSAEQLVVVPQSLLQSERWQTQLSEAAFDLLIVDEAHRIAPKTAHFAQLQQLCAAIPSVLLLTATPQQAGLDGHFARLQLLDPDRFHSFEAFVEEQQSYRQLTPLAEVLARVGADKLLDRLLDHYGTGRLMYRNSRAHVGGFPERQCHPVELDEAAGDDFSAKATWLKDLLRQHKPEKFILICRSAATVQKLYDFLRVQHGVHAAVFHEGMSLLERDRAAEFFASPEDGCPVLLCSEIGSEGRNFQFAHHLVLFDLPEHPDLLEQRIGRLDRLGQTDTVHIHVPFMPESRDAYLFEWYQAMQAFAAPNAVGATLYDEFSEQLQPYFTGQFHDEFGFAELIETTAERAEQLREQIRAGRDRLQELNAYRPQRANAILEAIEKDERSAELAAFMQDFWARFGLDYDELNAESGWLRPTEHMRTQLPGLPDEGLTVTFSRDYALANEQVEFLSWDHPQVQHALELLTTDSYGSTCVALMQNRALPAGAWFVELGYSSRLTAPAALVAHEFYPQQGIRLLLDSKGRDLTARVQAGAFDKQLSFIDKKQARAMLQELRQTIQQHIQSAWRAAEVQQQTFIDDAKQRLEQEMASAQQRLLELQQRNPAVRQSEVDALTERQQQLSLALSKPMLQLDSVRIVVNSPK
ncbi:RNA polymerase-associated protein RapA [Pseudidiomarina piscicola]|uniref:RNA polymerase-associated protein RapA n=1 Tax=Pseudidiomarina piscicola TaxID=2614830 RepID=A0A6S6WPK9_9GAMM|nr:SNF2-related protein [Pseudidiomarina piscicola]CAB0151639.1 RNA polymerase-associated protein RapA [Pseudidiomarina piscicola]VZT41104.1 RNA polymerase-associated protein RapA [Pseudomonas aeruginosa]